MSLYGFDYAYIVSIVNELRYNLSVLTFQFSHVNKWHNSPFSNNYFVPLKLVLKTRLTFIQSCLHQ